MITKLEEWREQGTRLKLAFATSGSHPNLSFSEELEQAGISLHEACDRIEELEALAAEYKEKAEFQAGEASKADKIIEELEEKVKVRIHSLATCCAIAGVDTHIARAEAAEALIKELELQLKRANEDAEDYHDLGAIFQKERNEFKKQLTADKARCAVYRKALGRILVDTGNSQEYAYAQSALATSDLTAEALLARLKAAEAFFDGWFAWDRWELGDKESPPPNLKTLAEAWRRACEVKA